jgi:predicted esterase
VRIYKILLPCISVLALATSSLGWQSSSASSNQPAVAPGVLIPRQVCSAKPDQSYAVYLPSHYNPHQRWPIVYSFDPDGRGEVPVQQMKDAAERYGYIVVGSNNSRNGSGKEEGEAAQAMWNDTHAHFAIDDRGICFAGFSGGARVASLLAQQCKCAAGVLLDGAGFAGNPPSPDAKFAVFAIVGTYDFNYPELSELDEKLEQAGFPHILRHFDGSHQWAPAEMFGEALAWFRLIAMKENREPRDADFIAGQKSEYLARAQGLEHDGHDYEAWRDYKQGAATFEGLTDTAAFQQGITSLAQTKGVREGAKCEKQQFKEQEQITAQIYGGLLALRGKPESNGPDLPTLPGQKVEAAQNTTATTLVGNGAADHSDALQQVEQKINALRQQAASEKNPDKLCVDRRALTGVFIGADEFGDQSMAAKNYSLAKTYYQLATDAYPDSVGALKDLATARALANDGKGAVDALRRAKQKSNDPAAFIAWLNQEPAFTKLRDEPQFRALLANP